MAKSQAIRYQKYTTIMYYFLDEDILNFDVKKCFGDKIVQKLSTKNILTIQDLIKINSNDIKLVLESNNLLRKLNNSLSHITNKYIKKEFDEYKRNYAYLLLGSFRQLSKIIEKEPNLNIDYNLVNDNFIKKVLESNKIFKYKELYNLGVNKVAALPRFGKISCNTLSNLIGKEKQRIDAGFNYDSIKKEINSDKCTKKQRKKPLKKKYFSIYSIAKGKPGKKFTIKEFLNIAEKDFERAGRRITNKKIKLKDGYIYRADSQQEITIIKKLMSHKAIKKLRGQCIKITYNFGGEEHFYYPDFIILTKKNKIIIMEVKEIAQMNTKQNLRKYNALKKYCKEKGYLYIMCDKSFVSYEKLKLKKPINSIEFKINDKLQKKGCFNYKDYEDLIKGKNRKIVKKIRKQIGIYIASNTDSVYMTGDLTYKIQYFSIRKK